MVTIGRTARLLVPAALALGLAGSLVSTPREVGAVESLEAGATYYANARRYSVANYETVAARSIPVADAAESALRSFVPTRLVAQELDLIDDDEIVRDGVMVLLGHEGDHVVALTTRRSIDAGYPSAKLVVDGFGAAEIGAQRLQLPATDGCGHERNGLGCPGAEFSLASAGARPDAGVAQVRTFDRHDVALVYLPRDAPAVASRPTLGLAAPTARIKAELARAEQLFGLQFTLVSPGSLAELEGAVPTSSAGGKLLVFAAVLAMDPLLGAALGSAAEVLEPLNPLILSRLEAGLAKLGATQLELLAGPLLDRLERAGGDAASGLASGYVEESARSIEPGAAELVSATALKIRADGRLDWPGGEGMKLLGARIDPDAVGLAQALLAGMAGDAEVLVIDFGEPGVLLLVPSERLVLNSELLAHDIAVPTSDPAVSAEFPELMPGSSAVDG